MKYLHEGASTRRYRESLKKLRVKRQFFVYLVLFGFIWVLIILFSPNTFAQEPTPPRSDPYTADYLPQAMRLLFPSLPASLDLSDTTPLQLSSSAIGFDVVALGSLINPESSEIVQPVTKTVMLKLRGGIRGRVFAEPAWLAPQPDRFINPQETGELNIKLDIRRDASRGAGLLPAQINWGKLRVVLNGAVFDYATPLMVGTPLKLPDGSSDRIFSLHRRIIALLDAKGDLGASISTPAFPNAGGFALGLIVDYLGEESYNKRLPEEDFSGRVAETLAEKDYNNDGWIGFKQADILLGAPGWVLGRKIR
jgi:hypothetical protein